MDQTQRMDGPARPPSRVIRLPRKERVNIALAVVAGALAVLVLVQARDTFTSGPADAATPRPTATAPSAPTAKATPVAPVAPRGKPEKTAEDRD